METIKTYNPVFNKIYRFMEKHLNAYDTGDFQAMVGEFKQFATELEIEMVIAVVNEIERLYKRKKQQEGQPQTA